jgi:hypothetical protein
VKKLEINCAQYKVISSKAANNRYPNGVEENLGRQKNDD